MSNKNISTALNTLPKQKTQLDNLDGEWNGLTIFSTPDQLGDWLARFRSVVKTIHSARESIGLRDHKSCVSYDAAEASHAVTRELIPGLPAGPPPDMLGSDAGKTRFLNLAKDDLECAVEDCNGAEDEFNEMQAKGHTGFEMTDDENDEPEAHTQIASSGLQEQELFGPETPPDRRKSERREQDTDDEWSIDHPSEAEESHQQERGSNADNPAETKAEEQEDSSVSGMSSNVEQRGDDEGSNPDDPSDTASEEREGASDSAE